jgi:23S rRNA (adenine2030-N6)-methyltransferase
MLSYRHAFHAGNFADVLKHLIQVQVLDYLLQKDKPIWYADTHAGAGGYALTSAEAQKNAEYQNGIAQLWGRDDLPQTIERYVNLVAEFNCQAGAPVGELKYYPGSPWFAAQMLRDSDRLSLYELHPQEQTLLIQNLAQGRRCKVFCNDGFQGVIAALPPKERRGLVLIDPPYEIKTDYEQVVETLIQAHKRFATGTYALWYPVVERARVKRLERGLIESGIRHIELYEMGLQADTSGRGMTASGMIVINPPWTLKSQMQQLLPWLTEKLARKQGIYRIETLVEE